MARGLIQFAALMLVLLLAFLTVSVAIQDGVDVLVVISFVVLAVLGFGVLGAMSSPPDE